MKYWNTIWFTSARPDGPANEVALFTSAPRVHLPGCISTTTVGPMLHFPWPKYLLVAVGNATVAPTPQITLCAFAGDRKNDGLRSPNPYAPWLTGWLTVG